MIQLDWGDSRPLYEQIKDKFKTLIITGALKEQDKIPSVRELAGSLAINPNTIQRAYKELEEEGYIVSLRAKGSFVAKRSDVSKEAQKALYRNLREAAAELIYQGVELNEIQAEIEEIFNTIKRGEHI